MGRLQTPVARTGPGYSRSGQKFQSFISNNGCRLRAARRRFALVKTPAELTERFRAQGLKITPQRVAVFDALHDNPTHPTAESVHSAVVARMPTVSLRTVYQTLNDLAEMGEISRLEVGTGSARFDPNVEERHHHLVCESCGMVRDLHVEVAPELGDDVPDGFEVVGAELVVRGRCRSCADKD